MKKYYLRRFKGPEIQDLRFRNWVTEERGGQKTDDNRRGQLFAAANSRQWSEPLNAELYEP